MPSRNTVVRAKRDLREGKRPSTAAGEFVREEIEHVRRGKHGARSTRQAIAIGLSKARRAGVPLPPPKKGRAQSSTRRAAARDYEVGQSRGQSMSKSKSMDNDTRRLRAPSSKRSRAAERALKREGRAAASSRALSAHARRVASARRRRGGSAEAST